MLGYALLCYINNDNAKNEQNGIESTKNWINKNRIQDG